MGKKQTPSLVVEHLQDTANLMYLTLVEYKHKSYLVIVDNLIGSELSAYVLDQADTEQIDIKWLLTIINHWYYSSSERYPISVEFSKRGLSDKVQPLLKTFKVDNVTRLLGKTFTFDFTKKPKIKRKKVQNISSGVEIKFKRKESDIRGTLNAIGIID